MVNYQYLVGIDENVTVIKLLHTIVVKLLHTIYLDVLSHGKTALIKGFG